MEAQSSTELTKQAIALKKAGDTAGAIPLLVQALNTTPNLEAAWLWLAACLTEPSERRYCLAQALIANPDSQQARAGLVRFEGYASVRPAVLGTEPIELPPDIAPLPVATPTQPLVPPKPKRSVWPILFLAIVGVLLIGSAAILLLPNTGVNLGIISGGNVQAIAQVPIQPTAKPTVEPSPVPLEQVDLAALLSDGSALPKGLTVGSIDKKAPVDYVNVSRPININAATLSVMHDKDKAGTVVIVIYGDTERTNEAYSKSRDIMEMFSGVSGDKTETIDNLGKAAVALSMTTGDFGTSLSFMRCKAVVDIDLKGDLVDNKTVAAYAKDLDSRLTSVICR